MSFTPIFSEPAHATPGAGVPIDTGFDFNSIMDHVKKFVLDGLAYSVAKIMVQDITVATVQWINSGFQGSPAFLTNPKGYFADVADQTTGAFITDTGLLSGLCSPFNVDVRLTIALGQAGYGEADRYTCTLSSIINNVQNSSINGASIDGFMNGDFNQGGWPAFIALSQPNNNSSGVYLQADSDLLERIGLKQGTVNQQLAQGGGFLSWQDCTQVSSSDIQNNAAGANQLNQITSATDPLGLNNNQSVSSQLGINNPPVTEQQLQSYNQTSGGSVSQTPTGGYQNCETKTPGSVINSSLTKVMGAGIDQLNLANSINEVVGALLSQLVNQVLNNGLGGVSQGSSGTTQSYIDQLSTQTNSAVQYQQSSQSVADSFAPYLATANQTISTYQQIVSLFETTKSSLQTAATCFNNLNLNPPVTSNSTQNSISPGELLLQVNSKINELTSDEAQYQTSLEMASSSLINYQTQAQQASTITNADELQSSSQALQSFISTQLPVIQEDSQTSQSDLTTAQTLIAQYADQAKLYLNQCVNAGGK